MKTIKKRPRARFEPASWPPQIHASGHLNYDEIQDTVQTVQPNALTPVHTQHPP